MESELAVILCRVLMNFSRSMMPLPHFVILSNFTTKEVEKMLVSYWFSLLRTSVSGAKTFLGLR